DDGRHDGDRDAGDHRPGDVRPAPDIEVVLDREPLPGDVLPPPWVVEAEGDHHRDRQEEVGDRHAGVDRQGQPTEALSGRPPMCRTSIVSSATYSGRTMNGRKLYVSPLITAIGVAIRRNESSNSPQPFRVPSRKPLSARISFQESVRITKLVKKGRITSRSRTFLIRPPRKAMV